MPLEHTPRRSVTSTPKPASRRRRLPPRIKTEPPPIDLAPPPPPSPSDDPILLVGHKCATKLPVDKHEDESIIDLSVNISADQPSTIIYNDDKSLVQDNSIVTDTHVTPEDSMTSLPCDDIPITHNDNASTTTTPEPDTAGWPSPTAMDSSFSETLNEPFAPPQISPFRVGMESFCSPLPPDVIHLSADDSETALRAATILKMHKYDVIPGSRWDISNASFQSEASPSLFKSHKYQDGFTVPSTPTSYYSKLSTKRTPLGEKSPLPISPRHSPLRSTKRARPQSREWSKSDWKLLDSCFTDERMEAAALMSLPVELANVNDIRIENVVDRFTQMIGGVDENWGPDWTQEKMMRRASTLLRRQRTGQGAPPTPLQMKRNSAIRDFYNSPGMSSRFGTPTPALKRKCPEFTLTATPDSSNGSINMSKYSEGSNWPSDQSTTYESGKENSAPPPLLNERKGSMPPPPPPSSVRRTISYLGSWIRPFGLKEPTVPKQAGRGALPVPPPDVLSKIRPVVQTPAPKPLTKPIHPKETVALNNVGIKSPGPPLKPKEKPQRMVQLYPVSPKPLKEKKIRRYTSSGSVKDMIRAFESFREGDNSSPRIGSQEGPTGIRKIRSSFSVRAMAEASS